MYESLLKRIFGSSAQVRVEGEGKFNFEINGLLRKTKPSNECDILATGEYYHPEARRTFYLLTLDDAVAYFRICTADHDSDYDEFACGQITSKSELKDNLIAYAKNQIEVLCKEPA